MPPVNQARLRLPVCQSCYVAKPHNAFSKRLMCAAPAPPARVCSLCVSRGRARCAGSRRARACPTWSSALCAASELPQRRRRRAALPQFPLFPYLIANQPRAGEDSLAGGRGGYARAAASATPLHAPRSRLQPIQRPERGRDANRGELALAAPPGIAACPLHAASSTARLWRNGARVAAASIIRRCPAPGRHCCTRAAATGTTAHPLTAAWSSGGRSGSGVLLPGP